MSDQAFVSELGAEGQAVVSRTTAMVAPGCVDLRGNAQLVRQRTLGFWFGAPQGKAMGSVGKEVKDEPVVI